MPTTNLRASLGKARVSIWTKHHRAQGPQRVHGRTTSTGPQQIKGGAEFWLELNPTGKHRSVLIRLYRTVLQSGEERADRQGGRKRCREQFKLAFGVHSQDRRSEKEGEYEQDELVVRVKTMKRMNGEVTE